jgi:phosphatidylglycerophosphate synthase
MTPNVDEARNVPSETVVSTAGPIDAPVGEGVRYRWQEARRRLGGAQKGNAAVAAYLRFVNRPLGGALACAAYAVRLTPANVTLLSAALSAAGLIVLATAPASVIVGIVVAVLLAVGYALDSADGQLARIRGGGTPAGEWLDHVVDIAKTCALHGSVLIVLYRHFAIGAGWLLVPLLFLLTQVTGFFSNMLRDALRINAGLSRQPVSTHRSVLSALALLPLDFGTLCWAFALLGAHDLFLGVYAALAAVTTLFTLRTLIRGYRGLGALADESRP